MSFIGYDSKNPICFYLCLCVLDKERKSWWKKKKKNKNVKPTDDSKDYKCLFLFQFFCSWVRKVSGTNKSSLVKRGHRQKVFLSGDEYLPTQKRELVSQYIKVWLFGTRS